MPSTSQRRPGALSGRTRKAKDRKPLLVGVAGGSGSGKTHLVHKIAATCKGDAAVLEMDQYFRTEVTGDPANINFDHPAHLDLDLMLRHLILLREGLSIVAPAYDFRTMRQTANAIEIEAARVVFVDGLFVLAEPFAPLMDFTIFLDVEDDQRLLGRILRDVGERDSTMEAIVDRYQRFVRPSYRIFVEPTKQNADMVVDFTYRRALFGHLLSFVANEYIKGRIDFGNMLADIRRESYRLGYAESSTVMPASVDIRSLAQAYPESARPAAVPEVPEAQPRLFISTLAGR